ncbi:hypothetical protein E0H39_07145 [Rhizobium leguminosarum bv. viciae]|uniref:hypothetical protein n=1 Tax=Rhizobium leguminosarum TaxID=384 RepID=UPI00103E17EB|nr:hypothetical protein [Rhizobium leguminosarum]TBY65767.1 hypothetical protein E0H39_07145 [Rhizobium leguminosarum bv. viciae]
MCVAFTVALLASLCASSIVNAQERTIELKNSGGVKFTIKGDSPTLNAEIDKKSIRVYVNNGPVKLCAKQNYKNPCMIITNKKIACDLNNCFRGSGDWRNKIRSVKFL